METFFNNILSAHFALVFVALLICLFGYGYPLYANRSGGGVASFAWCLWFLAAVICLIVCIKIAFGI